MKNVSIRHTGVKITFSSLLLSVTHSKFAPADTIRDTHFDPHVPFYLFKGTTEVQHTSRTIATVIICHYFVFKYPKICVSEATIY